MSLKYSLDRHKFKYYSTHNYAIYTILLGFGIINDKNEKRNPLGGDLIVELWKKTQCDGNYFIRVHFCNQVSRVMYRFFN